MRPRENDCEESPCISEDVTFSVAENMQKYYKICAVRPRENDCEESPCISEDITFSVAENMQGKT